MAEKKDESVDVDLSKATQLEPAEPTEVPAIMGSTFAERAAAAQGKQVDGGAAENKAVASKRTSAKKKS